MPAPDWSFEAIGTQWTVSGAVTPAARAAVTERIEAFDRTWSRFRADSVVSELATSGGSAMTGAETRPLLDLYASLHEATSGAVNPLVGAALAGLGYDASYSFRQLSTSVDTPPFDSLTWTTDSVSLVAPALIDIGAAGKGLLVDLVSAELISHGVRFHTVDAGSDLVHTGAGTLRVGLEHPGDDSMAIGVVELQPGQALCASATNRRAWGDGLHHVLDARTGEPTHDVVATWVIADTAMVADGVATALFFTDVTAFDCTWVRMHADGRVQWSDGWPGQVFAA